MNAEEKHPTNALASGLQNFWTWVKGKGRRLYIFGGITVLAVAVVVLLFILRRNAREAEALRWRELDSANTIEKLLELIKSERHQGRITQTLARLDLARIYTYERGLSQLGTTKSAGKAKITDEVLTLLAGDKVAESVLAKLKPLKDKEYGTIEEFSTAIAERLDAQDLVQFRSQILNRASKKQTEFDKAISEIETGRKYYLEAVGGLKDNPMLEQEAWCSLALAEQILSGAPKPEQTSEYRGSIASAIDYYKKAAAIHPNSEASKSYAKKAEEMSNDQDKVTQYYQRLYQFGILAQENPHDFGSPPFMPFGKQPGGSPFMPFGKQSEFGE